MTFMFSLTIQAYADLMIRGTDDINGYKLIYDTDRDITWYDYTNPPGTWNTQLSWANSLVVQFGGITYDNWSLPTALNLDGSGPCAGWDCPGSQMGHLYFIELENPYVGEAVPVDPFKKGLFQNLQNIYYWSSTEYSSDDYAWAFGFTWGYQDWYEKIDPRFSGIAVLHGNVSVIPEPATMLLLGSGLIGLAGYGRRKFFKK